EYMAFARPIVTFDLKEIHYSARMAAVYVKPNDVRIFAEKISRLLDDPEARRKMGEYGRQRIVNQLSWKHTSPPLLAAYARVFNRPTPSELEREIDQQIQASLRRIQFDRPVTLIE
ncbi:glycosyltransferase, partial [candidate division KSB1 bacterium]|nr:glycosyltransferase [candidate division KSB1 bacterium]